MTPSPWCLPIVGLYMSFFLAAGRHQIIMYPYHRTTHEGSGISHICQHIQCSQSKIRPATGQNEWVKFPF